MSAVWLTCELATCDVTFATFTKYDAARRRFCSPECRVASNILVRSAAVASRTTDIKTADKGEPT